MSAWITTAVEGFWLEPPPPMKIDKTIGLRPLPLNIFYILDPPSMWFVYMFVYFCSRWRKTFSLKKAAESFEDEINLTKKEERRSVCFVVSTRGM